MATDFFEHDRHESLSATVRREYFAGNESAIVAEHFESATTVLYLAVRGPNGQVSAQLFRHRATEEIGGRVRTAISRMSEDDLPPYVHCGADFLTHLTSATTPGAALWRECAQRWHRRLAALLEITALAEPGDTISLTPPPSLKPAAAYSAVVNAGRALVAAPGSTWPNLFEVVDLLGDGYVASVAKVGV